jgi:hypothetical protein
MISFGLGLLGSRILPPTLAEGTPKSAAGLSMQRDGNTFVLELKSREKAYLIVAPPVDAKEKGGLHVRAKTTTVPAESGKPTLVLSVDLDSYRICDRLPCNDCTPYDDCPTPPPPPPNWRAGATLLVPPCAETRPCLGGGLLEGH